MEDSVLEMAARDVTGKAVKRLRAAGMVPAVIHDHGKPSVVVQAEYQALFKAQEAAGKHHPMQLKAGGKRYTALIKQITYDPKYHSVTHVVFNAIKANEKVTTEIPVRTKFDEGNDATPAERAGLVVLRQLEAVEVEALPKDLPDALYFDGEKLVEVGDSVTVADLIVPNDVVIKADSAHPLATVFEPSALQAANDAAGGDADEEVAESETEGEGTEATTEGTEGSAEAKKDEKSDKKES